MKTRISLFLMAVVLAINSGCQSPAETAYVARATFNQSVADLTTARKADVITAADFKADIALADSLVPALDALDVAAGAESFDFWGLYQSVKPKLHDLTTRALLTKKGGK